MMSSLLDEAFELMLAGALGSPAVASDYNRGSGGGGGGGGGSGGGEQRRIGPASVLMVTEGPGDAERDVDLTIEEDSRLVQMISNTLLLKSSSSSSSFAYSTS